VPTLGRRVSASERKLQITGAAISPTIAKRNGLQGRAIIEVLRDAGPFDRFCLTSAACPECVKSHWTEPQARIASCALRRPTLLSDMLTANFGNLLQKLRQLGDIHRDPARLTAQADIETAPRASTAT
jgi:hypothetical protein